MADAVAAATSGGTVPPFPKATIAAASGGPGECYSGRPGDPLQHQAGLVRYGSRVPDLSRLRFGRRYQRRYRGGANRAPRTLLHQHRDTALASGRVDPIEVAPAASRGPFRPPSSAAASGRRRAGAATARWKVRATPSFVTAAFAVAS